MSLQQRVFQTASACEASGALFRDPEFPPGQSWMPARDLFSQPPVLFFGKIEPNDIRQGRLGDCYYLSALSVLAEKPQRITALFAGNRDNRAGVYCITLRHNGERQELLLDSFFPVDNSFPPRPLYSRNSGPELWVMLAEKAYAKIHGSYRAIENGDAQVALTDLTGAPAKVYDSAVDNGGDTKVPWTADGIGRTLERHDKLDHVMCASLKRTLDEAVEEHLGLITKHSYGLIRAQEIKNKHGVKELLIQLRNPWGETEWKGHWSDSDAENWTPSIAAYLGHEKRDDGLFWMSCHDFVQHFGRVVVLLVKDGFHSDTVRWQMPAQKAVFSVRFQAPCKGTICVWQRDQEASGLRAFIADPPAPGARAWVRGSTGRVFLAGEHLFSNEFQFEAREYCLVIETYPGDRLPLLVLGIYHNGGAACEIRSQGPASEQFTYHEVLDGGGSGAPAPAAGTPPTAPFAPKPGISQIVQPHGIPSAPFFFGPQAPVAPQAPQPPPAAPQKFVVPLSLFFPEDPQTPDAMAGPAPMLEIPGLPLCSNPLTCPLFYSVSPANAARQKHVATRSHVCLYGAFCRDRSNPEHLRNHVHMIKARCPRDRTCAFMHIPQHRFVFHHDGQWDVLVLCRDGAACQQRANPEHTIKYHHYEWNPETPAIVQPPK